MRRCSVVNLTFGLFGITLRQADVERRGGIFGVVVHVVGVEDIGLLLLVDRVIEPKYLSSDYLIVPIDDVEYLVEPTILVDCIVDILEGRAVHLVPQKNSLLSRELSPSQVLGNLLASLIARGVVDDYQPKVTILLLEDRLQMPRVPIVDVVEVGGNHHAGVQLACLAL